MSQGALRTPSIYCASSANVAAHQAWNVGDLRVIEYPEEPCKIFALDVLEGVGIVVRNTALLAVVVVRGAELLTEKERLALKKVAVDAVEVVFDLRG